MKLGEKIKKAREEKQLSQEELAKIIGLSKSEICRYERGTRYPPISTLIKLSNHLKKSIEDLLEAETEQKDEIVWGHVDGKPREVVYVPMYENQTDEDCLTAKLITKNKVAVAGGMLNKGKYIWTIAHKIKDNKHIKNGTRLLVYDTEDVKEGDLVAFHFCKKWLWVSEVKKYNGEKCVSLWAGCIEEKMPLASVFVLGKIVQLALDL